jgi:hypothetical protein
MKARQCTLGDLQSLSASFALMLRTNAREIPSANRTGLGSLKIQRSLTIWIALLIFIKCPDEMKIGLRWTFVLVFIVAQSIGLPPRANNEALSHHRHLHTLAAHQSELASLSVLTVCSRMILKHRASNCGTPSRHSIQARTQACATHRIHQPTGYQVLCLEMLTRTRGGTQEQPTFLGTEQAGDFRTIDINNRATFGDRLAFVTLDCEVAPSRKFE